VGSITSTSPRGASSHNKFDPNNPRG
jgi:hypothetical protein